MPHVEALEGLTARCASLALVHGLWVGVLAASIVPLLLGMRRWSRRGEGRIYTLALIAAVAGPWGVAALQRTMRREAAARPEVPSLRVSVVTAADQRNAVGAARPTVTPAPSIAPESEPTPLRVVAGVAALVERTQPFLLLAWLAGLVVVAARLMIGVVVVARWRRQAVVAPAPLQGRADRLARGLGLRRSPPVRVHPREVGPALLGPLRPMIVVPAALIENTPDAVLDAVLAHELAHHRRGDAWATLLQRLAEATMFHHPAVERIGRALRLVRERAADATAAALTGDPRALASALERVARLRLESPPFPTSLARALALGGEPSSLVPRVQEILGMRPTTRRNRLAPLAALPAAGVLALLGASLGWADDPPAAAPKADPAVKPAVAPAPAKVARRPDQRVQFMLEPDAGKTLPHRFEVSAPPPPEGPSDAPQVAYEVQFVTIGADAWAEAPRERFEPLADAPAATPAWTTDELGARALLDHVQRFKTASLLQAPKVTAFAGTTARIENTVTRTFVVDVVEAPPQETRGLGARPVTRKVQEGRTIELTGAPTADGTHLAVALREVNVTDAKTKSLGIDQGGMLYEFLYEEPIVREVAFDRELTLPEGRSLVVSTGPRRIRVEPQNLAEELVQAWLPIFGHPAGYQTVEQLAVVTPRGIILEEEEERSGLEAAVPQPSPAVPVAK